MERKIAQTELDPEEYDSLVRAARKTGLSIKEALRKAALQWATEASGIDPTDPIFHLKPVPWGDRKASERVD
ncbi:MAG TPA: hypothetical protein VE177_02495, partial [Candidatus Binatus sp.]|nr:hypothetical protein [Candidatus Binatus sp.]